MRQNSTGAITVLRRDPESAPLGHAASGFTVLAISSDPDDHFGLAQVCSHSGWGFLSVHSGRLALKTIQSNRIAAVVCERDLPDGNWRVVFDELEGFPGAPLVIVVSRFADDALWAEVLNMGGYDVLLKPFEPKELMWSLTSAYRHWESHPRAAFAGGPPPTAA
ncbi:MAG: response regulator [Bryobacterales bacterium]|nr:response regulator [Bryobacterales bacterium]